MKKCLIIPIVLTILVSGCSRFRKEQPIDTFYGGYKGNVSYLFKLSEVDKRLKDQKETRECRIAIYKHSNVSYLKTAEGVLILSDVKEGQYGVSFSIPKQKFTDSKIEIPVLGKDLRFKFSKTKADGYYSGQKQQLLLSYTGVIPYSKDTFHINIPFEAYYQLQKMDVDSLKKARIKRIKEAN